MGHLTFYEPIKIDQAFAGLASELLPFMLPSFSQFMSEIFLVEAVIVVIEFFPQMTNNIDFRDINCDDIHF